MIERETREVASMNQKSEILPAALRIEAAAKYVSLGRTSIYRLIEEGRLRPVKVGAATLIPRAQLDALLGVADTEAAA